MSSSAFSETLKSITTTKLNELSKKRSVFEDHKATLLNNTNREADQRKKVQLLVNGVKQILAIQTNPRKRARNQDTSGEAISNSETAALLKNIERFLEQARYDPTISSKRLLDWEVSLMKKLNVQSLKYQYATLYGELVNEWLTVENAVKDTSSMDVDGFEVVDKAVQAEARGEWEKLVFESHETDQAVINTYLASLFGISGNNKQVVKALEDLRKAVKAHEYSLTASDQFDDEVLTWTINGLLSSGLLSEEKNAVLRDFLASPVILAEVADVLNMRIVSIKNWSWEQEYIPVEQRRHLNGNYHIYIDEDLLEAIFLQYIGISWSVFFKKTFTAFSNSEGAWNSIHKPVSKQALDRRTYFLGTQTKEPSIQSKREKLYKSIFFMSQLPNSPYNDLQGEAGEEEADYAPFAQTQNRAVRSLGRPKQTARKSTSQMPTQIQRQMQMQQQSATNAMYAPLQGGYHAHAMPSRHAPSSDTDSEGDDHRKPTSQMETKQFLLHLLSTEILVNTKLHGEFTCARSEFETWSPSLPHSTIRSVLSFFGVSKKWLGFFNTFLEAPLKFVEDGASAEARTRKRGVPGAHSLSSMCGEAVLFVLDYAVNQHTDGAQLYRLHDDFWLWSSSHDTVVKGWEAITTFSETMGVTLNQNKTGTVRIRKDPVVAVRSRRASAAPNSIHESLPVGDIRWGFLRLDSVTGRFVIDQEMVDKHISELERQLQDKKSIFSWIQAWNTYAGTFFKSNFGKPANCFGRDHVDQILETMTRIQNLIFKESNIVSHLKETIEARFGVSDIPDGYLYFPTNLGGLELQNPFIGTIQVRNAVCAKPQSLLDDFFEDEVDAYNRAQKAFEEGKVKYAFPPATAPSSPDRKPFLSFEEFSLYREEFSSASKKGSLLTVFNNLLKTPVMESIDVQGSKEFRSLSVFDSNGELGDGYFKWVGFLHGDEMLDRFGGLNIVDKGLLPIGMVNLFRSGRIKWEV